MLTIDAVKRLSPRTKLRWFKLDNTRFRPQPRVWVTVPLVRVTGKRVIVEYAFKEKAVDPKWLELPTSN